MGAKADFRDELSANLGQFRLLLLRIEGGGSQNAGIVTLKKLCDGMEISLYDFFNTETFRTLEQEIK